MTGIAEQSPTYHAHRQRLLEGERRLRELREEVAQLRRELPPGPELREDYVFTEGPASLGADDDADQEASAYRQVRLSELFSPGRDELVMYHMMFDEDWATPCPMCNLWVDGFAGIAPHLADRVDFAVTVKAPLPALRSWARRRGWTGLRMLSSHGTSFNGDIGAEDADGDQRDGISVFVRRGEKVQLFYTGHSDLGDGRWRGIDLYSPVWGILDLLPSGRGEWLPRTSYEPTGLPVR